MNETLGILERVAREREEYLAAVRTQGARRQIYVYGAGMYGRQLAAFLQRYGIAVAGYAVTQAAYNQEHVGGLEVRPLADLLPAKDRLLFLVGVKESLQPAVERALREAGISAYLRAPAHIAELLDAYIDRPVMEITPKAGCSVHCRYCPQDLFLQRYFAEDRQAEMTFDEFRMYLDKMPKDIVVDFSGFVEPFLAKDGLRMVQYAHESGHDVRLFTTLVGLDLAAFKKIEDIPFKLVVLHLPDVHHYANIPVTDAYLELLLYVVARNRPDGEPFVTMANCQAAPDPRVADIIGHRFLISWDLIDRAGNLESENLRKKELSINENRGGYYCNRALRMNHNVLLPNGDVVLCCMDFGMQHVLGNLKRQSYEEIMQGREMRKIKQELLEAVHVICGKCTSLREV